MTRYEQGFLTKCAEYGVPEQVAGRMLKAAQTAKGPTVAAAREFQLPDVPVKPPSLWADSSEYMRPIDLTSTNKAVYVGSGNVSDKGGGHTGKYVLPGGNASITNSPNATVLEERVTPARKGWLGLGSKPAQTNLVETPIWQPGTSYSWGGKVKPVWMPTSAGRRLLDLVVGSQDYTSKAKK